LYTLFSTYGPVLDIVALKTMKMRGQAHVVFRDVHASTQAMRELQSFDFFGKPMKISYAKGRSDILAKMDGTFRRNPDGSLISPAAMAGEVASTELQQSIFNMPPSVAAAVAVTAQQGPGLKKPDVSAIEVESPSEAHGVKRRREEEENEEEESSDGDVAMEEDSSDEE
jgi:RNA recognition motif-containing protein